jgi:rhodanese-related sulfurtransferase
MNPIRKLLLALAIVVPGAAMAADAPLEIKGATTVDAKGVIELVEKAKGLVIVDNRREADYAAGHIEGAVRLLDDDMTEEAVLAKLAGAKDTPTLFYCNGLKCGRAAKAAEKAVGWGYSKVFYYAKGMEEWRAQGLPTVSK